MNLDLATAIREEGSHRMFFITLTREEAMVQAPRDAVVALRPASPAVDTPSCCSPATSSPLHIHLSLPLPRSSSALSLVQGHVCTLFPNLIFLPAFVASSGVGLVFPAGRAP